MLPIKLTLSLSLLASTAFAAHGGQNIGKNNNHAKLRMVKRTLFEDLDKRADAPFGYDRCGIPRTKPYVKKSGASPVPSAKWKPCPNVKTNNKVVANKAGAAQAVPTGSAGSETWSATDDSASPSATVSGYWDDEEDDSEDLYYDPSATASSTVWDAAGAAPTESYSAPSSPAAVDTTVYTTYTPEASSSSAAQDGGETFAAPPRKINVAAFGKPGSSASSSSEAWTEPASSWAADSSSSWSKPTPTTSEAAAAVTPYTGSNSGKLGLAWDWLNPPDSIGQWSKASKVYTWSAYPPSGMPASMEFLPQYWGPAKESEFNAQIANGAIKPGMTILGFNEPDQVSQANMAVADGVREYKRLITPLAARGFKLATPGCTSDPNGFNWIKSFLEQCAGQCGVSILQTHYYGTDPDAFIAYIQSLRQFGLPIIVSEYAAETFGAGAPASQDQVNNFLAKTQSWLDAQDDIIAYMFFGTVTKVQANGVSPANLMFADDSTAKPNALGWQYLNGA